jgi:NADH-quinone oxidoreductase subunit J
VTAHGVVTIAMAAVTLAGALMAVGFRNIFHNILGFALAMLGVAGVFLSLGADFVAAVFILVYVGAVAIAMVYAVMLSLPLDQPFVPRSRAKMTAAAAVALLVAGALWHVMAGAAWHEDDWGVGGATETATAADVGRRFLTDYVLAFELISLLLVVAMMGAVMVARRTGADGRGRW